MWWYLSDLARFKAERLGLENLASNAPWLTPLGWRTDDSMRLLFEADITIGERTFPVYLRYPSQFPHTPPSIFPRGDETRWSDHQFGPGGELCLEIGPDNWTSDIPGTQLFESAHRLLSAENPITGNSEVVASRHDVSLGQRLRATVSRLLLTRALTSVFSEIPVGTPLKCRLLIHFRSESTVYLIDNVTKTDGEIWINPDVPTTLNRETYERSATMLRVAEDATLPPTSSVSGFKAAIAALGFDQDDSAYVILKGENVHGFVALEQSIIKLVAIPAQQLLQRLDDAHSTLRSKSVTIIGCGSLGSKIAAMLARAGVCDFYLVDDDLLFPDNLVRHDLDWRDVGTHKAVAVAQRVRHVNPDAKVFTREIRIAGQESGGTADASLTSVVNRDLVVDATANPDVFNLLSAVAVSAKKPMVWAQVFGGGFGGLIARYRPQKDPEPQMMRRAVENWFCERGYKPKIAARDYATRGEGPPLIADDADVSSIAAPTARMVVDTLIGRDPSFFPASAYVIGLAPEPGLFTQAFETYPIEMPAAPLQEPAQVLSADDSAAELAEIVKIFER